MSTKAKTLRQCTRCKEEKLPKEFRKRRASVDGLHQWCKICCLNYGKQHYLENKGKYAEQMKKYAAENAETISEYKKQWHALKGRDRVLQKFFGITLEQYEELLKTQGGGCAICGRTAEEEGRNLAVDHSHKDGRIRGLLCLFCNKFVISRHEDSDILYKAAEYLKNADTGYVVPEEWLKGQPKKRKKKRVSR